MTDELRAPAAPVRVAHADLRVETDRLLARLPDAADARGLATMLSDPAVMRFVGGAPVPSSDIPAVIEKWLSRWRAFGLGPFVLERRADGRVLGRVGFLVWDGRTWTHATPETGDHGIVELGWAIAHEHWGHGYVTEAARAIRTWGRRERSVTRLISLIAPANTRSQRVAERLGACMAGTATLPDSGSVVIWEHP